jgi:hypothetical protein
MGAPAGCLVDRTMKLTPASYDQNATPLNYGRQPIRKSAQLSDPEASIVTTAAATEEATSFTVIHPQITTASAPNPTRQASGPVSGWERLAGRRATTRCVGKNTTRPWFAAAPVGGNRRAARSMRIIDITSSRS